MNRLVALCLAGVMAGPGCAAQDKEKERPWTKLTISPAAEPIPALKYQLLPELRDLRPGNAAVLYQRAHAPEHFADLRRKPDYEKYYAWLDLPLEKFPRDRAAAFLPRAILEEVDRAARRMHCDWEIVDQLRKDGVAFLLPDLQAFREYAALLQLRARIEMADGDFDKAVYTLQTGYRLGRHVAEGPTLIHGLVGVAITNIMNLQVEFMLQQPKAPNLYWALTDLPRPLADLRLAMQGERFITDALLPGFAELLADAKCRALSEKEIEGHLDRLIALSGGPKTKARWTRESLTDQAEKVHPQAKRFLTAQGRDPKDVDALPVVQAALLYALHEFNRALDDMRKWQNLPYWQAREGVQKVRADMQERRKKDPGALLLADLLLPSVEKVLVARHRLDHQVAALRVVEAIRAYAAAHDALPASLADIRGVPLPVDPFTGKEFDYRVKDGKAYLSITPPPELGVTTTRYEIALRPMKKQ